MPCEYRHRKSDLIERREQGCQFDNETGFYEFAGKTWCQFHLPIVDEIGSKSEKSEWSTSRADGFSREIVALSKLDERATKFMPDYGGVVFPGPVSFKGSQLPDRVSFEDAYFNDIADFNLSVFGKRAYFDGAFFNRLADFRQATFKRVSFEGSQFAREARFDGAAFHHSTTFRNAKFYQIANFGGAVGSSDSAQRGFQRCNFDGAEFRGRATFNYRQFFDTASFHGAKFAQAPEFHNCILHPDMELSNLELPEIEPDWRSAKGHYRTLKRLMGEIQARDDEALFYAREQRCLRALKDTPQWVKVASTVYEGASNYGQSAFRPFVLLLISTFIFFVIYTGIATDVGYPKPGAAFGFAVEQIVRPFFILAPGYQSHREWVTEALKVYPFWVPFLAGLQSAISLGLLTILFLALRWRFRRG